MNNTNKLSSIFNIQNKTILLTGATGYLGRNIAEDLLNVGANLILIGRSKEKLNNLEAKWNDFAKQITCYAVDFYNVEAFDKTLNEINEKHNIDVIINNAFDLSSNTGFNTADGILEELSYEKWSNAWQSGIYWAVQTTKIIGKQFIEKKKGSIINISSMYGVVTPHPDLYEGQEFMNPPVYSVIKSGIIGLTKYTASFWGKYNIRCNAVAPGPFPNTESDSANSVNAENREFLERLEKKTVLGRVGKSKELIGGIIYLSTTASSYMTGQTIQIDGGWTIT